MAAAPAGLATSLALLLLLLPLLLLPLMRTRRMLARWVRLGHTLASARASDA
jgi:hypothetical protein